MSRQYQSRNYDGSDDLRREIMVPHRPENQSTLAYDSFRESQGTRLPSSYHKAERKNTRWAKVLGNWLGKPKHKSTGHHEKIHISEPRPISPPSHARHSRLPSQQTQLPKRASRILPELEVPRPPSRLSKVHGQNHGKANEALGSHPVGSWLNRMERKYPAQEILLRRDSVESLPTPAQARQLPEPSRQLPADVKAERRKGRIFTESDFTRSLYEFPDPEEWYDDSDSDSDSDYDSDDSYWDDAGIDDAGDTADDGSVPHVVVTEPDDDEENEAIAEGNRISKSYLSVDHCYKKLWSDQDKELKVFRRFLVPLAYIIAEAEKIDVNDLEALQGALKTIISDRKMLFELYPLAHVLAEDQGINADDFESLPGALEKVFEDRDNAQKLVRYYKTTKETLEKRIAQVESKKNRHYDDGENYIRM